MKIINSSFSISISELTNMTASLFGFSRVTEGIASYIKSNIKKLLKSEKIVMNNNLLVKH